MVSKTEQHSAEALEDAFKLALMCSVSWIPGERVTLPEFNGLKRFE